MPWLWIGLAAAAAFLCVVTVGGAGLYWWYTAQTADEAPPPVAQGHAVTVHPGDDMIQWVRLLSGDERVLDGAGGGLDGSAPSGAYTLAIKVVGRSTASTPLDLEGPGEWTCTPAKEGRVDCVDETGAGKDLVLVAD